MREALHYLARFARASRAIPTTDLYFANACRPWLVRAARGQAPAVRRLGANSFLAGKDVIVCRRDTPRVVKAVLDDPSLRLTYVIDDDLAAAARDATLPADYRARLTRLHEGQHAALVGRAETVVVSTPILADRYAGTHNTVQLDPYWQLPIADDRHFEALDRGGPFRLGYLGSVTHGADRAFLFDVLAQVLEAEPRATLTTIARSKIGHGLDRHPRVRVMRPLPWFLYRRRHARLRLHLALYPMLDTPFNRGRSVNKLIEHAIVGAVGLYSADWAYAHHVRDGTDGMLLENSKSAWVDAILQSLSQTQALRAMQHAAAAAARDLNDPGPQRRFWCNRLGLEEG